MRRIPLNLALAVMATLCLLPFHSRADVDSESKLKIDEVQPSTPAGPDIDQTITNNKMRAETGAKVRYSVASQFNYIGGSVNSPLAEDRPNISTASGLTTAALLGGQVSGKMNISTSQSLLAGVGVRWISPLAGGSRVPDGYTGNKVDADNPYLVYQYLYRWAGVQSALQLQPVFYTNSNLVNTYGYVTTFAVSQNNIYELGHSGFSLGLYTMAQTGYFNNNSFAARQNQSDFTVNVDPFVEYQISRQLNLRTVTNLWNIEHLRSLEANTYHWDKVFQSVGLGISLTRDIFLYPNIQFIPDNIRSTQTNVALNSYINIF